MVSLARKITEVGSLKKEHILSAAEAEFEKFGFNGARMQRIADTAGVPKANIHYYFSNKQALYDAVLSRVIEIWNQALAPIDATDDPATVLENYVRMKVEFTRLYPTSTRIFAIELLNGGQHLSGQLMKETRNWTRARAKEIQSWIEQGKILPVDPYHLIFMIWSSTQHYAESETQVLSIIHKKKLSRSDYDSLADSLSVMVLRICGLSSRDC
ncbi:MAG: TetR family transcriptional regulator C-terminal domain-containing protein [bacterium]